MRTPTLGEQLITEKNEALKKRIDVNSEILRDFVKVTLLDSLKEAVADGYEVAPVEPPDKIRHLFADHSWKGGVSDMDNPKSPYREVWSELKSWADENGLYIGLAGTAANNWEKFSDDAPWEAFLGIKKPEVAIPPQRPVPPPMRIESRGIHPLSWVSILGFATVLILFALFLKYH